MIIAIDGLSINGKTTIAKMLSDKYGIKNFSAGAVYRCITLEVIKRKIDINNIDEVLELISELDIDFVNDRVLLNGKDVTEEIYTEEISMKSSEWASIAKIKERVRRFQKEYIKNNDTVMEGRDIGTRIAPMADFKFYIYSDFSTRVDRLLKKNKEMSRKEAEKILERRDYIDLNFGNFVKPVGAIEIDTTNLTIEEVFEIMRNKIRENKKCKEADKKYKDEEER